MGSTCTADSVPANKQAQQFGNSEGDCATPPSLYESAVAFMAEQVSGGFTYKYASPLNLGNVTLARSLSHLIL